MIDRLVWQFDILIPFERSAILLAPNVGTRSVAKCALRIPIWSPFTLILKGCSALCPMLKKVLFLSWIVWSFEVAKWLEQVSWELVPSYIIELLGSAKWFPSPLVSISYAAALVERCPMMKNLMDTVSRMTVVVVVVAWWATSNSFCPGVVGGATLWRSWLSPWWQVPLLVGRMDVGLSCLYLPYKVLAPLFVCLPPRYYA